MTDKFFDIFGKIVAVLCFLFVLWCAVEFAFRVLDADREYQNDTTPLLAPDTTHHKVKP